MKPPFFVLGCPRSGTTLLRNLLRSHPDLFLPSESHFIPPFCRAWGDPGDDREARRLGRRILRLHWVRWWGVELGAREFDGCRSFAEVVDRIYGELARREGARRWGDKTPGYALHIATLAEIFPAAQFVHIVRDGRDVALSLVRTGFGPRSVFTAAEYWRRHVAAARRDGASLGPGRYLEVRFEELLRDTEATMRGVCALLGEPFDARVLTPTPISRQPYGTVFGPRGPRQASDSEVVRANSGKWRSEMSPADLDRFEATAGDLLVELGYELGGGRAPRRLWIAERIARRAADRLLWICYQLRRGEKRHWVPGELLLRWAAVRARWRTR